MCWCGSGKVWKELHPIWHCNQTG
ncbi:MAG: hypothetical protein FJY15_02530 [Bacteroidetes bacterium]|nr:hypothetical protein [Bacteroidota bacterium]